MYMSLISLHSQLAIMLFFSIPMKIKETKWKRNGMEIDILVPILSIKKCLLNTSDFYACVTMFLDFLLLSFCFGFSFFAFALKF